MNLWGDEVVIRASLPPQSHVRLLLRGEKRKRWEHDQLAAMSIDWQRLSCVDIDAREKQWSEITTKDEHL